MLQFTLIKEKTTSKAGIGSPCLVPLSNLKYGVVLPPLVTRFQVFH